MKRGIRSITGWLVGLIILVAGVAVGYVAGERLAVWQTSGAEETSDTNEVHYHAGFAVFDGTQRVDFSAFRYMSPSPCELETSGNLRFPEARAHEDVSDESSHLDKVHLHNGNGQVVHVHTENITWRDFFKSLEYDTSSFDTAVSGGEQIPVEILLDRTIRKHERVVFTTGKYTQDMMNTVPAKERINTVGNQGNENCSK